MYQNAGTKGEAKPELGLPARRRANKRRGHGNWASERLPIVGVIGRESQQVVLVVKPNSSSASLREVVEPATTSAAVVNTDEWRGYNWLAQTRHANPRVTHTPKHREWARDADGDGVREVHTNTIEGFWTGLRNFLRRFRGVSKYYLAQYVAVYAWSHNHQTLTMELLKSMVSFTYLPS